MLKFKYNNKYNAKETSLPPREDVSLKGLTEGSFFEEIAQEPDL